MSMKSTNSRNSAGSNKEAPRPRLCHLKKWPHFSGYGFNLHAGKTKLSQNIGKVDPKSPADSAGLKEGDIIVEVNYVNISNENHQQVVKRIRNGLEIDGVVHDDEVVLLVVDKETDEYYKNLNEVVKNSSSNVLRLKTTSPSKVEEEESSSPPYESVTNGHTETIPVINSNDSYSPKDENNNVGKENLHDNAPLTPLTSSKRANEASSRDSDSKSITSKSSHSQVVPKSNNDPSSDEHNNDNIAISKYYNNNSVKDSF